MIKPVIKSILCVGIWLASYLFAWNSCLRIALGYSSDTWIPCVSSCVFLLVWCVIAALYKRNKVFMWWSMIVTVTIIPFWLVLTYCPIFWNIDFLRTLSFWYMGVVMFPYWGFEQITEYWVIFPLLQTVFFAVTYTKYCKVS